jgi:hypothetical protein
MAVAALAKRLFGSGALTPRSAIMRLSWCDAHGIENAPIIGRWLRQVVSDEQARRHDLGDSGKRREGARAFLTLASPPRSYARNLIFLAMSGDRFRLLESGIPDRT